MSGQRHLTKHQREVFGTVHLLSDGELDLLAAQENDGYSSQDFIKSNGWLANAGLVEPQLDDVRFDPNKDDDCGPTIFGETI